jgi:hypothetical protein
VFDRRYAAGMKTCNRCGETKPTEQFYANPAGADGLRPECKACTSARRKAWYDDNREKEIARVRGWQQANQERYNATQRAYRDSGKKKISDRKSHLKRTFGITVADYERMLAEQGGGCAICERAPREDIALHVDHDHRTGMIRGLLCFRCNNALGDLESDPELLTVASGYLVSFQERLVRERLRQLKAG